MRLISSTWQTAPSISPIRVARRRRCRRTAGASLRSASSAKQFAGDSAHCDDLVEWAAKEAFDGYRADPEIADLHPHREKGACDYIWHLFDKLDDLQPILK